MDPKSFVGNRQKKAWKEGVEISCVASLSIPIGMTKWTIPFYDKINLGTASQNGTFFSLVDMTMPHFFRVLNSNIAITKCIFSHSPFCIAFDIRTKLYAGATPHCGLRSKAKTQIVCSFSHLPIVSKKTHLHSCTVFENHRKSLIQHCERSELVTLWVDKSWSKMSKLVHS